MAAAMRPKRQGQLTAAQRGKVLALMGVVFVASAAISEVVKPGQFEYQRAAMAQPEGEKYEETEALKTMQGTSFQALMPTLLGVREVLASLMWVQADDYFHRGEYRPIISMVKQITAIDPHQLDVYATGAWHMAYNFMDKRLIENGVEFLADGCKNNPAVYDLFFERGYMHYDKTKDYPAAVASYEEAAQKKTTTGKRVPPSYVRHQLAHAMEKMGDIDRCVAQWERNLTIGKDLEGDKSTPVGGGAAGPNTAAAYHNLYITKRRMYERQASTAERERNQAEAVKLWSANVTLADEWLKLFPNHGDVLKDRQRATNEVDRLRAGRLRPLDLANLDMHVTVTRIAPRKLEIEGTIDALDLSRVRVRFEDKGYAERTSRGFDFKMDNCSLEWDDLPVNKNHFKRVMDLDKDPADMGRPPSEIYPLKADQFELSITYNPRLQAAFIQDRYGWNGEGLTAKPGELVIDETRAGVMNGKRYPLRLVRKIATLSREDVIGTGKKVLYKD